MYREIGPVFEIVRIPKENHKEYSVEHFRLGTEIQLTEDEVQNLIDSGLNLLT